MRGLIQQYTNETFGNEKDDDVFITKMLKSFILHFLYWRQARCILPISSKNKYIVSPLAPIKGRDIDDFDVNFNSLSTAIFTVPLIYNINLTSTRSFHYFRLSPNFCLILMVQKTLAVTFLQKNIKICTSRG